MQHELFSINQSDVNQQVTSGCILSDCKRYRYSLTRSWDSSKPRVMFMMLNPSTADGEKDDPTIRRCIGFAKSWGFGSIEVGNLFAFRATMPEHLILEKDPVGPENRQWVNAAAQFAQMIVCAWGNRDIVKRLSSKLGDDFIPMDWLDKLHYIELSLSGTPKHPLYLKKSLHPQKFDISLLRNL